MEPRIFPIRHTDAATLVPVLQPLVSKDGVVTAGNASGIVDGAAAVLIGLKDWDGAARSLEDFRQRYPSHPLQEDVGPKLAVAYLEKGHWGKAAGEFERVALSKCAARSLISSMWPFKPETTTPSELSSTISAIIARRMLAAFRSRSRAPARTVNSRAPT